MIIRRNSLLTLRRDKITILVFVVPDAGTIIEIYDEYRKRNHLEGRFGEPFYFSCSVPVNS